MTAQRLSALLLALLVFTDGPSLTAQVIEYTEVPGWPDPATSVAGTPAAWNFGQVSGVAISANGYIVVLHRGAMPLMLFDPGGRFVRAWGGGLFSNGKVAGIASADRVPGQSGYTAVYDAAGCHAAHGRPHEPRGRHALGADARQGRKNTRDQDAEPDATGD